MLCHEEDGALEAFLNYAHFFANNKFQQILYYTRNSCNLLQDTKDDPGGPELRGTDDIKLMKDMWESAVNPAKKPRMRIHDR